MWKGLYSRRRSKYLKTWAVIAVVMAALSFCLIVNTANCEVQSATPPSSPGFVDRLKSNALSLAALLAALTGIFVFIGKVFKPIRTWFVNWIRRALRIEDNNKINDDRMSALELKIKEESDERKKRCETMAGYSDTIEGTLDCLLASTNEINRKLSMSEESNRSLIRDAITKTFYKFNKRQAIPIHEKENMGKLFDVYKLYGGNSYVFSLMEIANEWEVLSGEDAPSSRQKN